MNPGVILLSALVLILAVALGWVGLKWANRLRAHQALERQLISAQSELQRLQAGNITLAQNLAESRASEAQQACQLENQEMTIRKQEAELARRPQIKRKVYKILTLGMKWTGKTSLTLKWANPLTNLDSIEGTKIERYERTVSQVTQKDQVVEHVFEISDWGGEHIVDAQQELVMDEIHGLLIVVDLGSRDMKRVDPNRVAEQLKEFSPPALRFFFGPKTTASCKAVVLFINKSDLIPGTPSEVEEQAKRYYQPLIDDLTKYSNGMDVRVLVGSATYGHSTHFLFSHFVEKVLPHNAYDHQLLQRMKSDFGASTATRTKTLAGESLFDLQAAEAERKAKEQRALPAAPAPQPVAAPAPQAVPQPVAAPMPQPATPPVPAPAAVPQAPVVPRPPGLPRPPLPHASGGTIKLPPNTGLQVNPVITRRS